MAESSRTGAAFIAGGTLAGVGVSATVGGIGLAGGFGAVGIGTTPVVAAGAVAGAAVYGAFKAIAEGEAAAFGAMGIGAVVGAGFSSVVGGMGIVAPKVGLAFGVWRWYSTYGRSWCSGWTRRLWYCQAIRRIWKWRNSSTSFSADGRENLADGCLFSSSGGIKGFFIW